MGIDQGILKLPVENVSDTAWLVAELRAQESERPDACFHDPLARKIVGRRGVELLQRLDPRFDAAFVLTVRTHLVDQLILRLLGTGVRAVVNLAAGLDTRPYRLALPKGVRWVEVDYPALLETKKRLLADATPRCSVEYFPVDLAQREARKTLLRNLGQALPSAVALTEGLLGYLSPRDVVGIALELLAEPAFDWWLVDMMDPDLLHWLNACVVSGYAGRTTEIRFQPWNGVEFFRALGWEPYEFHSFLDEGQRLGRFIPEKWPGASAAGLARSGIALLKRNPTPSRR